MAKRFTKHRKGFSIIEVIASICIISVGLLALYSVFTLALSMSIRNKHTTIAYQNMNKSMEETRAITYNSLTNGTTTQVISDLPSGNLTKIISNYNGDIKIKQIAITVTWREKGRTENVTASTLATGGGLND